MSGSERVWLAPAAGPAGRAALRLEASFEPAQVAATAVRGSSVVAPPHPLYGGRMDNPVVDALVDALRAAGYHALRFNYRGCGESDGQPSGANVHADTDYAAALACVRGRSGASDGQPIVAAGYSFGAATALRALGLDGHIERALVVAPPVSMIDLEAVRAFQGTIDLLVGDEDMYAPLPRVQQALAGLAHVRLHVLADCDHFFSAGTEPLSARLTQALS